MEPWNRRIAALSRRGLDLPVAIRNKERQQGGAEGQRPRLDTLRAQLEKS